MDAIISTAAYLAAAMGIAGLFLLVVAIAFAERGPAVEDDQFTPEAPYMPPPAVKHLSLGTRLAQRAALGDTIEQGRKDLGGVQSPPGRNQEGRNRRNMKRKMLTPAEYGASLPNPKGARWVRYLCEGRRIPGARRTGEGFRASWAIPEGAEVVLSFRRPGRPLGSKNKIKRNK